MWFGQKDLNLFKTYIKHFPLKSIMYPLVRDAAPTLVSLWAVIMLISKPLLIGGLYLY